jgi:hypothetical protein
MKKVLHMNWDKARHTNFLSLHTVPTNGCPKVMGALETMKIEERLREHVFYLVEILTQSKKWS